MLHTNTCTLSQPFSLSFVPKIMVTVKNTCIVKPANETPNEIMYLSVCDQISAITHAPTIYTYPKPSLEQCPRDPVDILRDSMSKALSIFYPLAGRLVVNDTGRLEIHCNSAGARLTEVMSQKELSDYGDFCPTTELTSELVPLVDRSMPVHERPLLLAQLTRFKCGGLCLGLGISHVVVDGQAALFFVSEWARIARGEQPKNLPLLDRTILCPKGCLSKQKYEFPEYKQPPLLVGHKDNLEQRLKPSTVSLLKLTSVQVDKLKDEANQQVPPNHVGKRPFSRYEVVTSHIWRSVCWARRHVSEQPTLHRTPVNIRNHVDPPLSPFYFGNALLRAVTVSSSGELASEPLGYTASRIRSTMENITDEYVKASLVYLDGFEDLSQFQNFHTLGCTKAGFYGNPNVEVTSWIGLKLQDEGFGWGKNEYMGPGAVGFDGKFFIIPRDDGFTILVRLQSEYMDDFKKFFYDEI